MEPPIPSNDGPYRANVAALDDLKQDVVREIGAWIAIVARVFPMHTARTQLPDQSFLAFDPQNVPRLFVHSSYVIEGRPPGKHSVDAKLSVDLLTHVANALIPLWRELEAHNTLAANRLLRAASQAQAATHLAHRELGEKES